MYPVNTAFLRFRLRQLGKIVREIPVPYLVVLAAMLVGALLTLYNLTGNRRDMAIAGGILILLVYAFHRKRRDYHFLQLADEYPARILCPEYLLLSLPVFITGVLHGFFLIAVATSLGCLAVGLTPQPVRLVRNGFPPPRFLPHRAFEWRAGIRRYGGVLLILYLAAYAGLLLPYLSLGILWLLTCIQTEFFNRAEPVHVLCSEELPPKRFLGGKLKLNLCIYSVSVLPVCLLYAVLYPESWWLPLIFWFYSTVNVALIIITKYAFYQPDTKITAGQVAITISLLGVWLPVLFPLTFIFLVKNYLAARRQLTAYLYAYDS